MPTYLKMEYLVVLTLVYCSTIFAELRPYVHTSIDEVAAIPLSQAEREQLENRYSACAGYLFNTGAYVRGMRNYIASLLVLYPDQIDILARDGEPLYDVAMELFPGFRSRFNLINLSRDHLTQMELSHRYLVQLGYLEGRAAKRVIADGGYKGSIQNEIARHSAGKGYPKTHFLGSENREIPFSGMFTEAVTGEPGTSVDVLWIEAIPKQTSTSAALTIDGDKLIPLSKPSSERSRADALRFRQDLKYRLGEVRRESPSSADIVAAMRTVSDALLNGVQDPTQAREAMSLLERTSASSFPQEIVRARVLNFGDDPQEMQKRLESFQNRLRRNTRDPLSILAGFCRRRATPSASPW